MVCEKPEPTGTCSRGFLCEKLKAAPQCSFRRGTLGFVEAFAALWGAGDARHGVKTPSVSAFGVDGFLSLFAQLVEIGELVHGLLPFRLVDIALGQFGLIISQSNCFCHRQNKYFFESWGVVKLFGV